jgi:5-(carboxyamino)imidazole ribonucleotide synthase
MPYGATHTYGNWQMNNLLGEDMGSLPEILITSGIHVHLYGKKEAKLGRKMGHTNRLLNI